MAVGRTIKPYFAVGCRFYRLMLLVSVAAGMGDVWAADVVQKPDPAAPAEAELTFQLNELRVLGNTTLPAITIEKVVYPYLGPNRSIKDVQAASAALEAEYHAQGFNTVYVDIPPDQTVDDGIVRLQVSESRLRRPSITGTRFFSNRQIRDAVPAAVDNEVPNLPKVQAQINAMNAVTPDRIVVPVLKAGPRPGTVDLEMKVQDKLPLHVIAELNNQYTASTSPLRAQLALSYDNAFGRQDSLALQYQTSPQKTSEVSVFAASYTAHLADRDKLAVTYIDSSSQVATIGDINVAGKGKTYSAQFIHPLDVSSTRLSTIMVGANFKQSTQDVNVADDLSLSTPLDYASVQAAYNWSLRGDKRLWSWNTALILGVPGLGSSRQEFDDKCNGCKQNFAVVHMDGVMTQKLPWDVSGSIIAGGQYSPDPLISNEQMLLGGVRTIRGYLEAEELGDVGIHGSLELRANAWWPKRWALQVTPYVFYDAGRVTYLEPTPGQERSVGLQSTGVGLDLSMWTQVTGTLVFAIPLTDASHTERGDGRVEFVVRGAW